MSLDDVKLHFVDNFDEVVKLFTWLGERREVNAISVDTETTGLVIGQDRVRLVQVGDERHGWALPWDGFWGLFADLVNRWDGDLVMHNAKFDAGMLTYGGVHVPRHRIRDTRVMSHILEPHMSTALKNQAGRHVDSAAAGLQEAWKGTRWTWANVPVNYAPYWQYGALDAVLTHHLYLHHRPLVLEDAPNAYELEEAFTWVAEKMERYGAHVDVTYASDRITDFERFCRDAERWVLNHFGIKKIGSNAQVIAALQQEGYEFTKATASGAVALDRDVLDSIDHPLAATVLQHRRLVKLTSTYLRHFVDECDADGVIHPSINTLGTRTSRMSMERPNLQNLPVKSDDNRAAQEVRNSISARPGNVMLMCDFDQVEMRMLADFSRAPRLRAAFLEDGDFFVNLGRELFRDPTMVKSDPRRRLVKNTMYAKIYSAGIAKMAITSGQPEDVVRAVVRRFDELNPEVVAFQREIMGTAERRLREEGQAYVRCPVTGRRQVADSNKIYPLVNHLIQGAAAATFKTMLLRLDAAGLGEFMVAPVHDEIVLDVPRERAREVAQTLEEIMNDDKMLTVPITASASVGERWGSKIEWSEEAARELAL